MAEGALRARLREAGLEHAVDLDSAGTGGWHAGQPPDPRAIACARGHGVDISGLRARQVRPADHGDFDWLLCADSANLRDVRRLAPAGARAGSALLLQWAGLAPAHELGDPYQGDGAAFERAWTRIDAAAQAIVEGIRSGRLQPGLSGDPGA